MADPTDLSDQIESAASLPQSGSVDGQSQSARSMGDLVQADQYLAAKDAVTKRRRGMSFSKLQTPGCMPDCGQGGNFDSAFWTG